jgi:hypothetical protein
MPHACGSIAVAAVCSPGKPGDDSSSRAAASASDCGSVSAAIVAVWMTAAIGADAVPAPDGAETIRAPSHVRTAGRPKSRTMPPNPSPPHRNLAAASASCQR